MGDYNKVSFSTLWMTSDGLETGTPCRVLIDGLDALRTAMRGANVNAADGTPYVFLAESETKGIPLTFRVSAMTKAVLDDLFDEFNALLESDDIIEVTIDGDDGTFALDCQPAYRPVPVTYAPRDTSEMFLDVTIQVVTKNVTV